MKKSICFFCGARSGNNMSIVEQSTVLAELFSKAGFDLVYGGGKDGLMGAVARVFVQANRKIIGIRPEKLIEDEAAFDGCSELIVVDDMFERKKQMMREADLFISLPGGAGTLDELMEVYTQVKIGFADKFCGVLNVGGFYQGLKTMLLQMVSNNFLDLEQIETLQMHEDPEELFTKAFAWWKQKAMIDKIAHVRIEDGQVLTARSIGKDKYYLPGGKRDHGESDEQTLIREIWEELSLKIIPNSISHLGTFSAQADGQAQGVVVQMTCYTADYKGTPKASHEIEEVRWLNYKDIDLVAEVDKKIFGFLHGRNLLK